MHLFSHERCEYKDEICPCRLMNSVNVRVESMNVIGFTIQKAHSMKLDYSMSSDTWFPTMWHFDKCRLRRACAAVY